MYGVSQAFIDAMRADKRKIEAKVTIDYTDPVIDQSIQVTANEQARISWPAHTADGVVEVPYRWASLDGTWLAGDARRPMPDTPEMAALYQVGWWGSQLAGAGGAFTAPYPTLTVTHLSRPIHSLRVVGDSARGEYPVDFTINLYAQDGTLLRSEVVTGSASVEWGMTLPAPVLDVARQELIVTRWSHAGRQAKIVEFFSSVQETYESGDIVEIRLLEEREASQGSLPVGNISANELALRLINEGGKFDPDNDSSPLYRLLKPNRRIRAWLGADVGGTIEWVPLGVFWSTEWDTPSDALEASVRALDRLEPLRKSTYRGGQVQQNVSLYTLAQQVLQDAGLTAADYVIDTTLQSIVIPWTWLPQATHREALRLIAEAGLAVVYCDRDGKIRITVPSVTLQQESGVWFLEGAPFPAEIAVPTAGYGIGPDDYFPPLRAPSRQEQVANEIVVTTQPLRPADTAQEVYRSSTPITIPAGQTVTATVQYGQPPVIEAVASLDAPPAGVSIMGATYYAWGAEVVIQNTGATAADVTLVITGKPLAVQGSEQVIARDETSITENGVLRFEFPANPLVQTLQQAQAIANALLASAKDPRRDVEVEWRGNPALELGDVVSVVTDMVHDRRSTYTVIRQGIEWAGALSARLTGRRIA